MEPINCRRLAPSPQNLAAAAQYLKIHQPVLLGQSWLAAAHADFQPAAVWPFWGEGTVGVYAELADRDIFNAADGENQKFWQLGDVLEMFYRPLPGEAYWEFHVTPENHHLQLRFDSESFFRARVGREPADWLAGTGLPPHSFKAETAVERERNLWRVCAWLPQSLFQLPRPVQVGDEWLASFCRYDFTRGHAKPVLSTTSTPTGRPDFHNNNTWRTLRFTE